MPDEFLCPITASVMRDPVIAKDGHTYERAAIKEWFDQHPPPGCRSPMTNELLKDGELLPNVTLRKLIQDYENRNYR
jgi:hypothetical protein